MAYSARGPRNSASSRPTRSVQPDRSCLLAEPRRAGSLLPESFLASTLHTRSLGLPEGMRDAALPTYALVRGRCWQQLGFDLGAFLCRERVHHAHHFGAENVGLVVEAG